MGGQGSGSLLSRWRQHSLRVGLNPGVLQDVGQRQSLQGLVSEELADQVLGPRREWWRKSYINLIRPEKKRELWLFSLIRVLSSWRRIKALLWILVNKFHVCPILCRAHQPPMTGSPMNAQNVAISPGGCVCSSQSGRCSQRVDFPPAAHSRAPQCTTDPPSHCMFSPQSFPGASSPESHTLYFSWKKAEREVSTVQRPRTRETPLPQLLVRWETLGNPGKSLP